MAPSETNQQRDGLGFSELTTLKIYINQTIN